MAEQSVEIVSIEGDQVALRALGACSECVGCGGRCNLFRELSEERALQLPRAAFPRAPRAGERWRLALGDDELLQQSLRGYGAALAGLVLGAASGYAAALALGLAPDAVTAAAALVGTLLAIRISKRQRTSGLRLLELERER